MSYVSDYADYGYINAGTIDDRITELLGSEMGIDDHEELAELLAFRDEVTSKVADWSKATILEEAVFAEHAREEAADIYGDDAVTDLGTYVDWARYADSRKTDYGAVVVGGDTFYAR